MNARSWFEISSVMEAMSASGLEDCALRKSESIRLAKRDSKTSRNAIPTRAGTADHIR